MRSNLLSIVLGFASLSQGHGSDGAPKLFGRNMRGKLGLEGLKARHDAPFAHGHVVERAGSTTTCGGSRKTVCAAGLCCSAEGYCGTGPEYCNAPDCQFPYGPGCDANKVPSGTSTLGTARTLVGEQPYGGEGIYDCVKPGVMALTFDDGPYKYTDDMLDLLKRYNAKATFFITGNNIGKGQIDITYPDIIKRMAAEGHQIASHTWSHQNLSQITTAQVQDQMVRNEMAIRNVLGYFPTYMRPPYSACDTACQGVLKALGYHVTYFDLDTDDYNNDAADMIQNAKNNFDTAVKGKDATDNEFLVIGHDIHYQTAYNLTEHMLKGMQTLGYAGVTVGDCLGDPPANWYRSANGAAVPVPVPGPASTAAAAPKSTAAAGTPKTTNVASTAAVAPAPAPPASTAKNTAALKVSTEANCGSGVTCAGSPFGNCCSVNGWCGSGAAYCGTGCQAAFGTCNGSPVPAPAPAVTTKAAAVVTTKPAAAPAASAASKAAVPAVPDAPAASKAAGVAMTVSTEANCGGTVTCKGSPFGNCCSVNGWCGSSAAYCGAGCQAAFGTCNGSPAPAPAPAVTTKVAAVVTTKPAAAPAASAASKAAVPAAPAASKAAGVAMTVSTEANCGGTVTCKGSPFGNCCSVHGWCGSSAAHCGAGCQAAFGTCT